MGGKILARCKREAAVQRYVRASMKIYAKLPESRRIAIRELVADIAKTPAEGRALWDAAIRGISSTIVSSRTGVSVARVLALEAEFYDRCPL